MRWILCVEHIHRCNRANAHRPPRTHTHTHKHMLHIFPSYCETICCWMAGRVLVQRSNPTSARHGKWGVVSIIHTASTLNCTERTYKKNRAKIARHKNKKNKNNDGDNKQEEKQNYCKTRWNFVYSALPCFIYSQKRSKSLSTRYSHS